VRVAAEVSLYARQEFPEGLCPKEWKHRPSMTQNFGRSCDQNSPSAQKRRNTEQ
jgi:hypothetical protein